MNNLPPTEVCQPLQNPLRALPQHLFARPPTQLLDLPVDAVQTAAFAKLHRDRYCARRNVLKRAIVLADIRRRALPIEIELSKDLLPDLWRGIRRDNLATLVSHTPALT